MERSPSSSSQTRWSNMSDMALSIKWLTKTRRCAVRPTQTLGVQYIVASTDAMVGWRRSMVPKML
eukprot:6483618-Amphidinium_carterae.1